jgi:hypothetical protein
MVTLPDLQLLRLRLSSERASLWEKPQATPTPPGLLRSPPQFSCGRASPWAKRQGTQRVKVMPRSRLMRLPQRIFYACGVSLALEQAIRPEWAIELVQRKRRQMRLQ